MYTITKVESIKEPSPLPQQNVPFQGYEGYFLIPEVTIVASQRTKHSVSQGFISFCFCRNFSVFCFLKC